MTRSMPSPLRSTVDPARRSEWKTQARQPFFVRFRVLAYFEAASVCAILGRTADRDEHVAAADALLDAIEEPGRLLTRRRKALEQRGGSPNTGTGGAGEPLTEREVDVLRLLDSDLSRREIASRLYLSHNTVKTCVQRLYHKLGVSSRAAAISKARDRGTAGVPVPSFAAVRWPTGVHRGSIQLHGRGELR